MSQPDTETGSAGATVHDVSLDQIPEPGIVISLGSLMKGHRELIILHAGERYRLRITANDKLILKK